MQEINKDREEHGKKPFEDDSDNDDTATSMKKKR